MNSRRLRVFLCHAREDKGAVRERYRQLREEGMEPWLDAENLIVGQDWQQEIRKAVRHTDVVVVCLSRSATTKVAVIHREIKQALDVAEEHPEDSVFIRPVMLEECAILERLSKYHVLSIADAEGIARLTAALRVQAARLSPTDVNSAP